MGESGPAAAWHQVTRGEAHAALELVWLHGWGQDHRSLCKLADLLTHGAYHRLYDAPGFGQTPPLFDGAGSADYADALAALLPRKTGRRVIIGHSFGARIATQFAARHPAGVDALIFIAGAGIPKSRSPAWRLRAAVLKQLGRAARLIDRLAGTRLADAYRRRFGSADYQRAGTLRATLVSVVNEDLTAQAKMAGVPVLLLYGDEDRETPPEIGEKFAAAFADAELEILTGYGHLDILSNGAYQCQRAIERFLARFSARFSE